MVMVHVIQPPMKTVIHVLRIASALAKSHVSMDSVSARMSATNKGVSPVMGISTRSGYARRTLTVVIIGIVHHARMDRFAQP